MKRIIFLLFVFSLLLTACATTDAKDDAGVVITSYADPLAEHLIGGILQRDYAAFSQDFDESMLKGIPESGFQDILNLLDTKVGACSTYEVIQTGVNNGFPFAIYTLQCEQSKKGVFIRLVFSADDPHQVTGLWFDGAELR